MGIQYARKLLFICSRNQVRSVTAEKMYQGFPGYEVRSAGTQPGARIKVTAGLLGWADIIFMMEKSHLNRVRQKFPEALEGKQVVVLGVPDEFDCMEPALIDELAARLSEHVEVPPV